MRTARGSIYKLNGYFHLESSLLEGLEPFSLEQAHNQVKLMQALAVLSNLEIIFWQFHSKGFGILLRKETNITYSKKAQSEALIELGQLSLSRHCIEPHQNALLPSEEPKWLYYENLRGQLDLFIKTFKQRITRAYNQKHARTGGIWKDRAKLFTVPDTVNDLQEVAAYLLAKPELETKVDHSLWPSTCTAIANGDASSTAQVCRIFKRKQFSHALLEKLSAEKSRILSVAKKSHFATQRGPKPEWRPDCETSDRQNANVQRPDSKVYQDNKRRDRAHFLKMLERYQRLQEKTGLKQIPWGYPDDPELRSWAAQIRGRYNSKRLPQWQLAALENSPLLLPVRKK